MARRRPINRRHFSNSFFVLVVLLFVVSSSSSLAAEFVLDQAQLEKSYVQHLTADQKLLVRDTDFEACRALNASRRPGALTVAGMRGLIDRSARLVEISGYAYMFDRREHEHIETLAELFFPLDQFGQAESVDRAVSGESKTIDTSAFALQVLNLSRNGLTDDFLDGYSYGLVRPSPAHAISLNTLLIDYFSSVRLLQLSHNSLRHIDRRHFGLFVKDEASRLETVLLDHNGLLTIRHDAFYDLTNLKYLDVSFNRLKILHPFTFTMCSDSLLYLDLSHNRLQALYKTTPFQLAANESQMALVNETMNSTQLQTEYQYQFDDENTLTGLKHLRLAGNPDIRCDCGLLWVFKLGAQIETDDFTCKYENVTIDEAAAATAADNGTAFSQNHSATFHQVPFRSIKSEQTLENQCRMPNLVVNVDKLKETSTFEFFRWVSRSWFNWAVFPDYMPPIIPFPYLTTSPLWPAALSIPELANQTSPAEPTNESNETVSSQGGRRTQSSNKHIFFTWRMSDVIFDCEDELNEHQDENDQQQQQSSVHLKSAIIWKTQYGYLSYLDHDLAETFRKEINASRCSEQANQTSPLQQNRTQTSELDEQEKKNWQTSFQIFYKMNKLTKIYQNMSILVSSRFGTQSVSQISVNERNQLKITNIRKVVAGPIVCIALNARGIRTYEFDINMRSGIGENFIYSLFISLISCIIPSIAGIIICCYCEYEADKNYPMTPPCYPTPLAATPPNFDINEWMSNAASYLPNLNISETLEQVSKKLRKGMEKATVTVKSLGLTSSAYIYSMYEQSSQRFQDIRSYMPNVNVPTLSLPTMRYPPMGDLANRMRMGMGNMFIHFKEFCGTSDLTHTPSIVDIEADTNASKAVGRAYIIDQINLKRQQNTHYRFLNFIREESKRSAHSSGLGGTGQPNSGSSQPNSSDSGGSSSSSTPTTSGLAPMTHRAEVEETLATTSIPASDSKLPIRGKDSSGVNVYVRTSQIKHAESDDDDDDDGENYDEPNKVQEAQL